MSWSRKYKKSIDCDNPKGFSQKAHCAGRRKRENGDKTKSSSLFSEQFKPYKTPEEIAKKHGVKVSSIEKQLKIGQKVEREHTQNDDLAMIIALQHLDEIPDYYARLSKVEKGVVKEDLRKWFDPNHPKGGWKRYNTKGEAIGPCAREPGEPKPKCLSNEKAAKLRSQGGAKKIASAVRRKRKQDPVANRRGKGGKPKMVSNKIEENALNYDWDTLIRERPDRYCPKCEKLELRSECKYGPKYWDMFSLPAEVISSKKDFKDTLPYAGPDALPSSPTLSSNQMKYNVATVHPANESKEMDHEYSMARSELSKIEKAAKRLKKKMKGEGNIEAWVQSKITRAADYIDTAADYIDSGEMSEEFLLEKNVPTKPSLWSRAKSLAKQKFDVYPSAYANGWAAKWYKKHGGGWKSVSESLNWKDDYVPTEFESVDIVKPDPLKPSNWRSEFGQILEQNATAPQIGGWKIGKPAGQHLAKPSKQKPSKFGVDKTGLKGPEKPFEQYVNWRFELIEAKKSEMKCNKPKAEAHGSGETGKSHVVKACEGGKEKLIRFGQLGVKGSPKKKGESKEYASRRHRFQTRHAKNIAKGKMSAAYWSNRVKW